jgi:hypothetical protein
VARIASGGRGRDKEAQVVVQDREPSKAVTEALKPLDRLAVEMERKWGCGRLVRLVSPEMAAKFGSAQDKLNEAIRSDDGDEVARRAAVMVRGWQALDKAATEAGAEALPARVLSVRHEGRSFLIVWDRTDLDKVAREALDPSEVVTVGELLTAYDVLKDRIAGVKRAFPGAEVTRVSPLPVGGDGLPF